MYAALRHLPDTLRTIRELESRVRELERARDASGETNETRSEGPGMDEANKEAVSTERAGAPRRGSETIIP
jgi:hypothetical protein